MNNLDTVFERNRVTKLGIDAMITNYLRLEKELYAAQTDAERYRWLRTRPVEDCTTPRIEVNMWTCNVSDEGISDSVNDGEVLAGKTLDAAIDRELVLKTGIPVDDCNQGLSLTDDDLNNVRYKKRLIRIMGTFDLATGHADTFDELLTSLESELSDVLGHYREALKVKEKNT